MRPSTSAVLVVVALGSEERVGLSFAVALSLAIVLFVGSNIVSRVHAHRGFNRRQNILALWDKPEHSPEPPSDAPPLDEAEEADPVAEQEATIASLALFGLQTLPSTEAAINEAFKKAIRKVHACTLTATSARRPPPSTRACCSRRALSSRRHSSLMVICRASSDLVK